MTPLSHAGRALLDRRNFLAHTAGGLSGIALASLCAAEERGIRPHGPHFQPKAKRVLHIFCSGACSHLDTFDYKPELIKRDGQPMPGSKELVTFQGANGNLTKSPDTFRPRGQCGKYTSDLLPHIGACADEICFIHSM